MRRERFLTGGSAMALTFAAAPACARPAAFADITAQMSGNLAAYVRTMDGVVRYAVDSDEQFPSASTIKLVIMVTAFRAYERGTTTPQTIVKLREADLVSGSEFLGYAQPGATYSVGTLVEHMIRQSDNSAANALITHFGFEEINAVARAAGMSRTQLKRHFMDFSKHNDNKTTAHDLGILLYEIERGSREALTTVASAQSCRKMIEILLGQEDRNKIPAGLPSGIPVANKTGEVDGVRNDAAIIDPFGDRPYVIVVLTKNLDDESTGIVAISRISRRVYETLRTSVAAATRTSR